MNSNKKKKASAFVHPLRIWVLSTNKSLILFSLFNTPYLPNPFNQSLSFPLFLSNTVIVPPYGAWNSDSDSRQQSKIPPTEQGIRIRDRKNR